MTTVPISSTDLWITFLAGGCTGLFVDGVLYPLDVFKTRRQATYHARPKRGASDTSSTTTGHSDSGGDVVVNGVTSSFSAASGAVASAAAFPAAALGAGPFYTAHPSQASAVSSSSSSSVPSRSPTAAVATTFPSFRGLFFPLKAAVAAAFKAHRLTAKNVNSIAPVSNSESLSRNSAAAAAAEKTFPSLSSFASVTSPPAVAPETALLPILQSLPSSSTSSSSPSASAAEVGTGFSHQAAPAMAAAQDVVEPGLFLLGADAAAVALDCRNCGNSRAAAAGAAQRGSQKAVKSAVDAAQARDPTRTAPLADFSGKVLARRDFLGPVEDGKDFAVAGKKQLGAVNVDFVAWGNGDSAVTNGRDLEDIGGGRRGDLETPARSGDFEAFLRPPVAVAADSFVRKAPASLSVLSPPEDSATATELATAIDELPASRRRRLEASRNSHQKLQELLPKPTARESAALCTRPVITAVPVMQGAVKHSAGPPSTTTTGKGGEEAVAVVGPRLPLSSGTVKSQAAAGVGLPPSTSSSAADFAVSSSSLSTGSKGATGAGGVSSSVPFSVAVGGDRTQVLTRERLQSAAAATVGRRWPRSLSLFRSSRGSGGNPNSNSSTSSSQLDSRYEEVEDEARKTNSHSRSRFLRSTSGSTDGETYSCCGPRSSSSRNHIGSCNGSTRSNTSSADSTSSRSSSNSGSSRRRVRDIAAMWRRAVMFFKKTHAFSGFRKNFLFRFCKRYYPGFPILALGTIPSSGLFFLTYDATKQGLINYSAEIAREREITGKWRLQWSPAASYIFCSTLAEFSSCCVRTPFEMLKQQMQLGMHFSALEGARAIYARDKWRGFFVGFNATIVRDLPFVGVEMALWETLKKYFCSLAGDAASGAVFISFFSGLAGLLAGAGAAVVTNPLDVVKTRIMTQQDGRYRYKGYLDCFSSIVRKEGFSALFLGLQLRLLWVSLGGCLLFGGYDAFKLFYQRLLLPDRYSSSNSRDSAVADRIEVDRKAGLSIGFAQAQM